jgi:WD40 repeat protein
MKPLRLLFFMVILLIITVNSISQSNPPSLTGEYWLLTVDEAYRNLDLTDDSLAPVETDNRFKVQALSPSGRYVLGQTMLYSFDSPWFIQANLYLWDVSESPSGQPAYLASVPLTQAQAEGGFMIAPDDSAIAIHVGDEVELWALPSLEPYASLPIEIGQHPSVALAWALDSKSLLIAHQSGSQLTEWHPSTGDVVTYSVDVSAFVPAYDPFLGIEVRLVGTESGWLYHLPNVMTHQAFLECRPLLVACVPHVIEENRAGIALSADRQVIVVKSQADVIYRWGHGMAGYGLQSIFRDIPTPFCPSSLSFTGRYVYSNCGRHLWDTQTWQRIRDVEGRTSPYWLTEDSYYITLEPDFVLRLYDIHTENPLASLDITLLDGINPSELSYTDLTSFYQLSDSGNKLLINLGGYLGVFVLE